MWSVMKATSNDGMTALVTDNEGATEGSDSDGIPDIFNWATHIHLETQPKRYEGN